MRRSEQSAHPDRRKHSPRNTSSQPVQRNHLHQRWNLNLSGSFILRYHNASLVINGQNFSSKEIPTSRPLPPILHPILSNNTYEELLTLEAVKELHINNTLYINQLKQGNQLHNIMNSSFILIVIITLLIIIFKVFPIQRKITFRLGKNAKAETPTEAIEPKAGNHIPILYVASSEDTRT